MITLEENDVSGGLIQENLPIKDFRPRLEKRLQENGFRPYDQETIDGVVAKVQAIAAGEEMTAEKAEELCAPLQHMCFQDPDVAIDQPTYLALDNLLKKVTQNGTWDEFLKLLSDFAVVSYRGGAQDISREIYEKYKFLTNEEESVFRTFIELVAPSLGYWCARKWCAEPKLRGDDSDWEGGVNEYFSTVLGHLKRSLQSTLQAIERRRNRRQS